MLEQPQRCEGVTKMKEALEAALEALTNPSTTMTIHATHLIKEALAKLREKNDSI